MKNSKSSLIIGAIFSAVIASGCTSGPSTIDLQNQAEQTKDDVMERMEQNAIDMDISAVFESDGYTILQIRNMGSKTVNTGNLTVNTGSKTSDCRPVQDVNPGSAYDCRTSIDFPDPGETTVLELEDQENLLSTYNCTVKSGESVAC